MAGERNQEIGIDSNTGKIVIQIESKHFRPEEVDLLLGDPGKAKRQLGWNLKTSFKQLIEMMVDVDLKQPEREQRADG